MEFSSFSEIMTRIRNTDTRYTVEAYQFVREALDYTVKKLSKPTEGPARHISAAELLEGIRQFALQEYGPMTLTVLTSWGVRRCEDFGQIVFNLVQTGFFGKTEQDSIHDFEGGYDFESAFRKPFTPPAASEQNSGAVPRDAAE